MKILIVEDNQQLSNDIAEYLKEQNFSVEQVFTFSEAHEKIVMYEYDMVILDLGLPDGTGMDLLEVVKKHSPEMAVIILTATHALEYKLQGLNLGADDYLTKPFHMAELNARIRTILRRKMSTYDHFIKTGSLEIDLNAATVKCKDQLLNLTRKEYDMLLYFVQNKNRLLTKESIAEYLWGDHADQADNFDFVYNHIKNLRRKITEAGGKNQLRSVYGVGYKFESSHD